MWFLARSKRTDIVMLDEPDVYMHPDLQRRLIRFLDGRFRQTIVTTHSVEILSEVEPRRILLVDKKLQNASFADSVSALQTAVDRLGATHNLQLSRLWTARRLILVEGDDMYFLKRMHGLLFPDSIDSLDAIPNFPIRGWGGWNYAVGSAMLLENSVGELIKTYCILDSDFHTPDEIASRKEDAKEKHVSLHVWARKEIESYLLVPETIARVISAKSDQGPTVSEVSQKLMELADSLRDEVHDCYVDSFLMQDRPKGGKPANQKARAIVKAAWGQSGGALARVPPKSVLSSMSAWSKEKFGVSFSKQTILQEMRADEIDPEVTMVLAAIEEITDFSP
jgi:hypothetical protein